jgi:hypothetical protein
MVALKIKGKQLSKRGRHNSNNACLGSKVACSIEKKNHS